MPDHEATKFFLLTMSVSRLWSSLRLWSSPVLHLIYDPNGRETVHLPQLSGSCLHNPPSPPKHLEPNKTRRKKENREDRQTEREAEIDRQRVCA